MSTPNPFAQKAPEFQQLPPEVGGNFCPFMAVNSLLQQRAMDPKAILANGGRAQPVATSIELVPNVLKCLGERCALWHAPSKACALKAAAVAQIEAAQAMKSRVLA